MARVEFQLEEQAADMRSFEFAYRFRVQNNGATPINLVSITPRLAQGITLLEVKNPTSVRAKEEHTEICEGLTDILQRFVLIRSEAFRQETVRVTVEMMRETIGTMSAILKWYFYMLLPVFRNNLKRQLLIKANQLRIKIAHSRDAEDAFKRFIKTEAVDSVLQDVFETKVAQLKEFESQAREGNPAGYIARLEPDSFYAETYVLKYRRRLLAPSKYTVSVEGTYQDEGKNEVRSGAASTTVIVSPHPLVLTMFSILSGLLGAALKYAVTSGSFDWKSLAIYLFASGPGLTAAILAAVLFNVYEYTDIGKRITMPVSWRSALLIGVLCGLFSDRVLNSLRAFVEAPK